MDVDAASFVRRCRHVNLMEIEYTLLQLNDKNCPHFGPFTWALIRLGLLIPRSKDIYGSYLQQNDTLNKLRYCLWN